jgi:hypothetical protein
MSMLIMPSRFSLSEDPAAVSIWPKLVAWWELDETKIVTAIDQHIHGFNATYSGSEGQISSAATIRSGGASSILFNGNSYALCSNNTDAYILGAQDHAVFAWYRPQGVAAFSRLISSYDSGSAPSSTKNDQFGLYADATFHIGSQWRYSSSSIGQNCVSTRTLAADVNYFLGYNKDTANKAVHFFVNNVSEAPVAYANEPTGTSLPQQISQLKGQTTQQAHGALQGMMIFSAQLTDDEINYLWNGGAGRSYASFKAASGH